MEESKNVTSSKIWHHSKLTSSRYWARFWWQFGQKFWFHDCWVCHVPGDCVDCLVNRKVCNFPRLESNHPCIQQLIVILWHRTLSTRVYTIRPYVGHPHLFLPIRLQHYGLNWLFRWRPIHVHGKIWKTHVRRISHLFDAKSAWRFASPQGNVLLPKTHVVAPIKSRSTGLHTLDPPSKAEQSTVHATLEFDRRSAKCYVILFNTCHWKIS